MNTHSDLWQKLSNKEYRENFAALQLKRGVPFQIRALLKDRRWTQERLAEQAGLTQGAVSRAQDPEYGNLTINTIARVAAGFDVAFIGRFAPFSDLVDWFENLSEESGNIEPFDNEYRRIMQSGVRGQKPRRRSTRRRPMPVVPHKLHGVPFTGANAGTEQLNLFLPEQKPEPPAILGKLLKMPPRGDVWIANRFQGALGSSRRFAGGQ